MICEYDQELWAGTILEKDVVAYFRSSPVFDTKELHQITQLRKQVTRWRCVNVRTECYRKQIYSLSKQIAAQFYAGSNLSTDGHGSRAV
jgi:hypothetical protein